MQDLSALSLRAIQTESIELTLVLVEPPVLSISNPKSSSLLLSRDRASRVERDDNDSRFDSFEGLKILGIVRNNLFASLRQNFSSASASLDTLQRRKSHLGPDISISSSKSSDGSRISVFSCHFDDLLEKTV